jgi:FemAB-related protein (PEP-CTERM system-associated)
MNPTSLQAKAALVSAADDGYAQKWDAFVNAHPAATSYHRWNWKRVIQKSFGWRTYYLAAEQDGRITGILPLVWQKSLLFGNFLTSVPFLNAGGIVAETPETAAALLAKAAALGGELRATHIEFRNRRPSGLGLETKTSKITVTKELQSNSEAMLQALDKKVRSDVRKSMQSGFSAEFGGAEFLADFYEVFAVKMRDLGTPVYPKKFFRHILNEFPRDTFICCVRHEGKTVAASLLIAYRDRIEAHWSASLPALSKLKPNMFMYWSILCFAGERGYKLFDFGRSTVGSGTHKFKMQWSGREEQLYWEYWLPEGSQRPELNPDNPRYRAMVAAWRKLPLLLTKLLGPPIVRRLP